MKPFGDSDGLSPDVCIPRFRRCPIAGASSHSTLIDRADITGAAGLRGALMY